MIGLEVEFCQQMRVLYKVIVFVLQEKHQREAHFPCTAETLDYQAVK